MKKIICLLLALTCVFALISCGGEKGIDKFIGLVDASEPTKIVTHTHITYGEEEPLEGRFVTSVEGNNSTLEYWYERNAIPGVDDSEDPIMEIDGVIYYKDGKYSEDGENWTTSTPDANVVNVKFELNAKRLGSYVLSKDGKTLTTIVTAANAEKLFGIKLENVVDDSVVVTIKNNGTYLVAVTISYSITAEDGTVADVIVDTSYTYNVIPTEGDDETTEGGGEEE